MDMQIEAGTGDIIRFDRKVIGGGNPGYIPWADIAVPSSVTAGGDPIIFRLPDYCGGNDNAFRYTDLPRPKPFPEWPIMVEYIDTPAEWAELMEEFQNIH